MRAPLKLIGGIAVVVAIVLAAFLVVQLVNKPGPLKPIDKLEYSQYQAVPNFDDSVQSTTSQARIRSFSGLVEKYGIDVSNFNTALDDNCTGGLATMITVDFTDHTTQKFEVYSCGGNGGNFVQDLTNLVTGWRKD